MKKNRGFAAMTEEQKREIASAGGKAAHAKGKAHRFNSVTAKEAGQKGGRIVSRNSEHMSAIGQKGGLARSKSTGLDKLDKLVDKFNAETTT
ncbi:MAG TPA: hypothetical protein VHB48_20280 [Chitinophagaceae bacterium]|jgi:general stress protein YciG|nr:hypothetical protein [Chitinophagaceae bacterium]